MSLDPKQWRLELIVQKGRNGAGLPQILVRHESTTAKFRSDGETGHTVVPGKRA